MENKQNHFGNENTNHNTGKYTQILLMNYKINVKFLNRKLLTYSTTKIVECL